MGLLFRASTAVDSRIIDSIMLAAASEQRWHVIDALNKRGHSWPESGPEQASVAAEGVPLTIEEAMDKFEISVSV